MITKERLEELVKEEKGCYVLANTYTIGYIHLNKKYEPKIEPTKDGYNLWVFTSNEYDFRDCIDDYKLFETKEQAEFALRFKRIPKTEYLDLPDWEEFLDKKFVYFYDKNHNNCCLHYLNTSNEIYINIGGNNVITVGSLTKENYLEACELCKKLWLGEKV